MPTPSEDEIAYTTLLEETDARIERLALLLHQLAVQVDPSEQEQRDDYLTDLGYRHGLSGVHHHILKAHHELHGARTEIAIARAQIPRYRRPP